jgi:20S proteasome subunit beta 6
MKTDDKGPEKATTHHPSKGIRNMKKLQVAVLLFHTLSFVTAANFEPYELNGGLISAVAGNDFCIVGADTRMIGSGGYLLSSRNHLSSRLWSIDDSKLMDDIEESLRSNSFADDKSSPFKKLFDLPQAPIMIGAAGCTADCSALKNVIRADIRAASHLGQIAKQAKPDQVASLVSQTLYSRRGFPYYSFCCVAGINGVYVFDAVGSYEQVAVATAGTGRETLQPILDRKLESELFRSAFSLAKSLRLFL